MEKRCPRCYGPVESYWTCHTWPRTLDDGREQWMACQGCGSATHWYCVAWQEEDDLDEWMIKDEDPGSGCGWRWTEGLNPRNPRAIENHRNYPGWYSEE